MNNKKVHAEHVQLAKLTAIAGQLADCLKHLQTMSKYVPKKKVKMETAEEVKKPVRNRSCCVKEGHLDREQNGYFVSVFQRVKQDDAFEFFNHTRMNEAAYDFLVSMMDQSQLLTKHSIRQPFSPEFRLAIYVHFVAQNLNAKIMSEKYKIGKETVRSIVKETCECLWQALSPIYLAEPQLNEFKHITSDFYKKWKIPNCIGALDGRYIQIKCPTTKRGTKYDCRNEYVMVIMAACNSKYEFTFVDIATHERGSDGDFFDAINFSGRIINKQQECFPDKPFPTGRAFLPHYFVADSEFFVSTENIVKPYYGTNLTREEAYTNKCLQPAVDAIDNAFGILAARWPILQSCFHLIPETAEKLVLSCVALHNFILHSSNYVAEYCPPKFADWYDENMKKQPGEWRQMVKADSFKPIGRDSSSNQLEVSFLRDELCYYFNKK